MASLPVDAELAKDTHGHTQWAETERGNGNGSDILDEKSDQAKHHDELGDAVTKTPTNLNQHAHLGDDSDGHVAMTPKRFIAMLILCMSYVGMASFFILWDILTNGVQVLSYLFSSWEVA